MNLSELYKMLVEYNIDIFNWKMYNSKARIIYDEDFTVYMDYSQIHSYTEEKELLAEELGHYNCDAYYTLLNNQIFINKQEYKSKKWKALNLCPLKSILRCIKERKDKYI